MQLTEAKLNELKELAGKATPGPWEYRQPVNSTCWVTANGEDDYGTSVRRDVALVVKDVDAVYMTAASPNVLLALVEEVERLRGECDRLANDVWELEREKDAYYEGFDKLAKEMGVFELTDPGQPETFAIMAAEYRCLVARAESLRKRNELLEQGRTDGDELLASHLMGREAARRQARRDMERLEREADWLADKLTIAHGDCPWDDDDGMWGDICKRENCDRNAAACWRKAARVAVEELAANQGTDRLETMWPGKGGSNETE